MVFLFLFYWVDFIVKILYTVHLTRIVFFRNIISVLFNSSNIILITEINIIKSMSSSLRISRRVSATFGLILAVQSASVPKTNFLSDTRLGVRQNITSVFLTSSLRPILKPTCIQPSMPWNGKICWSRKWTGSALTKKNFNNFKLFAFDFKQ